MCIRMCHDWRIRILFANAVNAARRELDVHVTVPLHKSFCAPSVPLPTRKILVRNKKNVSISRGGAHDFIRIAAGADHV